MTYRIDTQQLTYSSLREAHAHRMEQAARSGKSVRLYSGNRKVKAPRRVGR